METYTKSASVAPQPYAPLAAEQYVAAVLDGDYPRQRAKFLQQIEERVQRESAPSRKMEAEIRACGGLVESSKCWMDTLRAAILEDMQTWVWSVDSHSWTPSAK